MKAKPQRVNGVRVNEVLQLSFAKNAFGVMVHVPVVWSTKDLNKENWRKVRRNLITNTGWAAKDLLDEALKKVGL